MEAVARRGEGILGHFLTTIMRILTVAWMVLREAREVISGFLLLKEEFSNPSYLQNQIKSEEENMKLNMREYQLNMEKLFHKNQLFPRILGEFKDAPIPFKDIMNKHSIRHEFGFDLLVQMALHKRATLPTLVGILRKHFRGDCQATADALLVACEADLVDWSPDLLMFIVRYDISEDVQGDLDRYQYPLPMILEPKKIKTNEDTGYLTSQNSVILRNNHHNGDVCLDHLNRMNRIKLTINQETATMVKNRWRHLDKAKPGESRRDYQARVKAFDKYDRTAKDVMEHLGIAGNEFYLTHKYDKRGRVYCQGYHVNYQGTPWNKAVVEFVNKEVTK